MLVVSAVELKQLSQQINGTAQGMAVQEALRADREERHRLSRERVTHWDNTILGQRRKKLHARNERIAQEELLRKEADKIHAEEESERRKAVIDRAKSMQYNNQDPVRAFHSRVLLYQVLQERDLQLAMKRTHASNGSDVAARERIEGEARRAAEMHADAMKSAAARVKRLSLAKDQMGQVTEKLVGEMEARHALLVEQAELVRKDEEHRNEVAQKEQQKYEERLAFREQLSRLKMEKQKRWAEEKARSEEEDERIEAWVLRKAKQVEIKKNIEKKWFEEALVHREQIGLMQQKICNDHDAKVEEQVKKAMILKEGKAQHDEIMKHERKEQRIKELNYYYDEFVKRKEENVRIEQEQERALLDGYNRIKDEALAEQMERKSNLLITGKSLQSHHRAQVERFKLKKQIEHREQLECDQERAAALFKEDNDLEEYMKSVANAPWAAGNRRLKEFVDVTLSPKKPNQRVTRQQVNTKERLGFIPGDSKTLCK
ncbi:hypothetical protein BC830DRAFT_1121764 [Chytriomyces sp. MP71]|nr:hypothetical protein BC830DRAFT_1121764 [Chytriomyces sp. MP71]